MKDYLDHFDIVWTGTEPLLPPRRSKPPRWWTMGGNIVTTESDPKETARAKEAIRPRRAYNRKTKLCPSSPISNALSTVMPLSGGATTRGRMASVGPSEAIDVFASSDATSPSLATSTMRE